MLPYGSIFTFTEILIKNIVLSRVNVKNVCNQFVLYCINTICFLEIVIKDIL